MSTPSENDIQYRRWQVIKLIVKVVYIDSDGPGLDGANQLVIAMKLAPGMKHDQHRRNTWWRV